MKVVCIVQARMTSTRLPGKVLLPVMGKPLLAYQVERLRHVSNIDELVIATSDKVSDEPIVEFCKDLGVHCFRGSEENVLSRYYGAALAHDADVVVRITSDCPLIDPTVVEKVVGDFLKHFPEFDYVVNTGQRTYPRGMDTEVFTFSALEEAANRARDPREKEHVTPYFYFRPERFKTHQVTAKENHAHHRWTVDTKEDLQLITNLLEYLYPKNPKFCLNDALMAMKEHPEWELINKNVEQKHL